jgi:TRAP-type C4-dicarboxylate transport system permease large subunit
VKLRIAQCGTLSLALAVIEITGAEVYPVTGISARWAYLSLIVGFVGVCVTGMMLVCYCSGHLGFLLLADTGTLRDVLNATFAALPVLLMPAFIVALRRLGIATPTEVSVIAVAYALLVSALIYRDLTITRVYARLSGPW